MPLLFVYGSLKQGFPNAHVNRGRRVAATAVTVRRHPFWLVRGRLPCLFEAVDASDGTAAAHVTGELYEVTPEELRAMDALERVGEPGGYRRATIEVRAEPSAELQGVHAAFVYLQDPALLAGEGPHVGPLAVYTQAHAQHLSW